MKRTTRILLLVAITSSALPMLASAETRSATGTPAPPTPVSRPDSAIVVPQIASPRPGMRATDLERRAARRLA